MNAPVHLHQRQFHWLVLCAIVVQVVVALTYALTLHNSFKTSLYDIGTYTQAFHNLFAGKGLLVTIHLPPQSLFAQHVFPMLYSLAPFYYFWPDERLFRVANVVLLAAAAFPLYFCALRITRHAALSFTFSLCYLFSPFVLNAAIWDFHDIAFAAPLIACIYLALLAKNRRWFIIASLALLMVKEHYGLAVAGFGLLWGWHHREWRFGVVCAIISIMITVIMITVVLPLLSPGGSHFMLDEGQRYAWLADPLEYWQKLIFLAIDGVIYLVLIGMSGFLVPYLAWPWLLPGMADLSVNLASFWPMMRSPYSYHSAALAVVFMIAAAQGITKMIARNPRLVPRDAIIALVAITLGLCYEFAVLPCCHNVWEFDKLALRLPPEDKAALKEIQAMIPSRDPIAVQNNVGPHLAARDEIHHFPDHAEAASWVVLRLDFPYRQNKDVFGSPYSVPCKDYMQGVRHYLNRPHWSIAYWNSPWLVLRQGGKDVVAGRTTIGKAAGAVEIACIAAGLDSSSAKEE